MSNAPKSRPAPPADPRPAEPRGRERPQAPEEPRPDAAPGSPEESLQSRTASLEMELAHKNFLLQQGFQKFIEAAERLQERQRVLERRVAELNREVEEKKNYLSNIFESLAVGVLVTDLEGRVTSVNRTGQGLLGAPAAELEGRHVNELLGEPLLPASSAHEPEAVPAAAPDEPISFRRADGERFSLQLSASLMQSEQNEPLGFIFNVQDVTLLKKLEEQAERQNRFTAMGEMAANIAHEIRNPLGSIELFTSLVQKRLDPADESAALMSHISSNVASMNHIIANLLAYTKPRAVSPQRVELHGLLRQAAEMWRFMAEQHGVAVESALDADSSEVMADAEQLKQVFNNLVMNATQAMPEGGRLDVATRCIELDNPRVLARFNPDEPGSVAPGRFIEVRIQDTGSGIPKDILRKIFDPFFTTKARGTGLGLAIVHHILTAHRATIDIESQIDQGTKVVMMFPLIKE